MWGARVEIERGYRLEANAVALSADIAELREDSGLAQPRPHPRHLSWVSLIAPLGGSPLQTT